MGIHAGGGGSTNAGMDWNGMDYWNGLQGSNSQLFFHTLSKRVSMASHTAMKMHGKIVLESMEGSCVRIGPGVDSACMHNYALKQCSKHCHTPEVAIFSGFTLYGTFYTVVGGGGGGEADQQQNILNAINFAFCFTGLLCL